LIQQPWVCGAIVARVFIGEVQLWNRKMSTREGSDVIVMRELPGIAGAKGVLVAEQVKNLGDIALQALGLGVVRLGKAKALGVERSSLTDSP